MNATANKIRQLIKDVVGESDYATHLKCGIEYSEDTPANVLQEHARRLAQLHFDLSLVEWALSDVLATTLYRHRTLGRMVANIVSSVSRMSYTQVCEMRKTACKFGIYGKVPRHPGITFAMHSLFRTGPYEIARRGADLRARAHAEGWSYSELRAETIKHYKRMVVMLEHENADRAKAAKRGISHRRKHLRKRKLKHKDRSTTLA